MLQQAQIPLAVNGDRNKTKRSYTQLDSRKQVIAFYDRVITIHKGSSTPTKITKINSKQIQYKVENFNKIHVLSAGVRIGQANNMTRCFGLSKRHLPHA